jgi:hypothetical protein
MPASLETYQVAVFEIPHHDYGKSNVDIRDTQHKKVVQRAAR